MITWNRIESIVDLDTVEHGVMAPLADPLWLLGRQWQIGELAAEDGGTPIAAKVATIAYPIDRLTVGTATRVLDASLPLEARVESEPPAPPDVRMRLSSGRDLAARLDHAPAAALPAYAPPAAQTDRTAAALVRALGSRAVDGESVAQKLLAHGAAAVATQLDAATAATSRPILETWLADYLARTGRAAPTAWNDERAAYQFSLAASLGERDLVLDANDYRGGTLDWCDFSARVAERPAGVTPAAPITNEKTLLPTPLRWRGGPTRRFFEIETTGASLSLLAGAPPDVGTAMLVEVMLVAGGDWFTVPAEMPVGSAGRVKSITVTDTFEQPVTLTQRLRSPGWRMFECGDDSAVADLLVIVPTVHAALEGPAIEALRLGRDEAANVVWAIEDTISDPLGLPQTIDHPYPALPASAAWTYEPLVPPPPSWYPLVRRGPDPTARLIGATIRPTPPATVAPRGRFLDGWPAVGFLSADVPHDGLLLERRWQLAVGADDTRALWITRLDHVGRGPTASRVAADQLAPPTTTTG